MPNEHLIEVKNSILADCGFSPTKAQRPIIDDFLDPVSSMLITGGWRAGKSETSAMLVVLSYYIDVPPPPEKPKTERLYWILAKEFETARPEFEKSAKYFKKLGLIERIHVPDEGQCTMRLVGNVVIKTRSADDEWKIAEEAPNGVLLVEAGRLPESVWHRTQGRLIENRAWCVLSGTLEGSDRRAGDWYPNLFKEWQKQGFKERSYAMPTWSNTVIFTGRNDPAILDAERNMPEDLFQEKFGAIPVKPSGLIIKEFSNEIHVGDFPYDDRIPVEIAVDPGYRGAYAVLAIQLRESIPHIIREIYVQGLVTEEVILKAQHDWPFFGKIQHGAIDIAAKAHAAMPAPIEVWQRLTNIKFSMNKVDELGGIDLLRTLLKVDPVTKRSKAYMDSSCKGIIAECGGGQSPIHGMGAWLRNMDTMKIIDRNNHSIKAFIYWIVGRFGYSPYLPQYKKPEPTLVPCVSNGMY